MSVHLIIGLIFLINKVWSEGDVHGLSSGLDSTRVLEGYDDYGSYGRYAADPLKYFKLGYSGMGHGFNQMGLGYDDIHHKINTLRQTGIGHYPNSIGRMNGVYGSHGLNDLSSNNFYGHPVGYNNFGYNNIGVGYNGYGSGINPHFGTHGYGDHASYGFSPYFGNYLGLPHVYIDNYYNHDDENNNNDGSHEKEHGQKDELISKTEVDSSSVHDTGKDVNSAIENYANIKNSDNDYESEKYLQKADHYDQAVKNEEEEKNALAHKKGYVTKGFETFHHKDEKGKTTTFFDEGNDEGNHYDHGGQYGSRADSGVNNYHDTLRDDNFYGRKHSEKGQHYQGILNDRNNNNNEKFVYGDNVHHGNNKEYERNFNGDNVRSNHLIFQQHPYHHY